MSKKYKLELSKEQLSVIQEALEFFSRFSSGQLKHLPPSFERFLWDTHEVDEFIAKRSIWENALDQAKVAMFDLQPNASLGIGNEALTEEAKIAYDIYRPILELFTKEYNEEHPEKSSYSVYDHPGNSYSKEGRIIIK
jgi:hypothetical protein